MANCVGTASSTYFKVKDVSAFRDELVALGIGLVHDESDDSVMIHPHDGFWPSDKLDPNDDTKMVDLDLLGVIYPHLQQGQVAILLGVSTERISVNWYGMAVNHLGQRYETSEQTFIDRAFGELHKPFTVAEPQ